VWNEVWNEVWWGGVGGCGMKCVEVVRDLQKYIIECVGEG
jgi:hypothetical protein